MHALLPPLRSYETLGSSSLELFRKVGRWGYLIVDEAHRLKNREAKALAALRSLGVPLKLALTGTPLQNHVGELWSILNFLDAKAFPCLESFMEQFGSMTSAAQVSALNGRLRPYLLQRKKGNVDLGLTPMEETLVYALTRPSRTARTTAAHLPRRPFPLPSPLPYAYRIP